MDESLDIWLVNLCKIDMNHGTGIKNCYICYINFKKISAQSVGISLCVNNISMFL
jgi:hypothetical protein